MNEGMPQMPNAETVEDIKDYDNATIRAIVEKAGYVQSGDAITPEDYEAIKTRATVLAQEKRISASAEELLLAAFIDRRKVTGNAPLEHPTRDALRNYVRAETGITLTDAELDMYEKSALEPEEWTERRHAAQKEVNDIYVAVDNTNNVVEQGGSHREALINAQRMQGGNGQ